uniref:Protein TIC 214 n=1 Tax=Stylidium petiolare TaxID=2855327 RepID=A0A8F4WCV0_9ASTR|nr:hypothetical protein [Stylidium petiolare]
MILKSFLLGNLVSLCMKIINSVVVVGLYYGFMTTFSIGPYYLFLLRTHVMEEGTEKKVSATTGFITGQLMMFISIYYAPLHLALGRPHTITVLALPYLLFHFFWNNHKHFFDYGSTTRNSMRNLSIQCIFLNNLIFQLFNHFILPSSMLARLVNIYMFRCNNKMLFVTSSFVGWLIGHILFMKWIGLVLVWIRQNHSIRSNKYLVSEFRNYMSRILSIFLFITCVYYLGRIPSPILTKKLKQTSKTEERDVEMERAYETKGTKQEQEGSTEEDLFPSPKIDETEEIRVNGKEKRKDEFDFTETFYNNRPVYYLSGNQENWKFKIFDKKKKDEDKDLFWFEKPLATLLFDYKRWNRPLRYIKNKRFQGAIRKEASHYFFYTCRSDGKQRIAFTYPPSLSTFGEMIKRRISLSTLEKLSSDELSNDWFYINKHKNNNFNNELINRIEALETGFNSLDILEKKTRLCNDETQKDCLLKIYDPFLNGICRGTMKKFDSSEKIENRIETFVDAINKIHLILLLDPYSKKFEQILKEGKINIPFLLNEILNASNFQQYKKIKEIRKKVPIWSYNLISELEQNSREYQEGVPMDHQIRSRKGKRIVILTNNKQHLDSNLKNANNVDQSDEVTLMHYSKQSDFRRGIIKGSIRAQRRKMVIWELFQGNVHSPLFLVRKSQTFSFDIPGMTKIIFRNWIRKKDQFKMLEDPEKHTNGEEKKENNKKIDQMQLDRSQIWDSVPFSQLMRSSVLITQSIFRKYIRFPLLIIAKNIGRVLLLQPPEWSEDFQEWNKERHIKCTYSGVELSETEFPTNWLTEGIQIKILFPFCLKPWHQYKLPHKDRLKKKRQKEYFCFLTVWGKESELPFGAPRKGTPFFEPIFQELKKEIVKLKKTEFRALRILKERKKWIITNVLSRIIEKLSKKKPIRLFKGSDSNQNKQEFQDSVIRNKMIHESVNQIRSMDWTNYSLTEENIQNRIDRTKIIINQIEQIRKENNKVISGINTNPNKTNNVQFEKSIWKILKRRNARVLVKLHYFLKIFIEKLYIDIFLCISNTARINIQLFLKKKILDKSIYTNETNQDTMHLSYTSKDWIINNSRGQFYFSFDLSSLSQAYVFYKVSQTRVNNFYKSGTSFVLKTGINDFFESQGISPSELKNMKLINCGIKQWKNWLKSHYQYNLSPIRWSGLLLQKSRNQINQYHTFQNKDFKKWNYNTKEPLFQFHSKKKNDFQMDSLSNKISNFKKYYRYDLFSYKYVHSERKKKSYPYGSPLQVNRKQEISSNYIRDKKKLFSILEDIYIKNYPGKVDIRYTKKVLDRKSFDWNILNFFLRKKGAIQSWIRVDPSRNPNTQIENYQIIDKMTNKSLDYLRIHSNREINPISHLFDWMGMNEQIFNRYSSNLEFCFFPEFRLLSNIYKMNPWIIRSKLLLFNRTKNFSETQKINGKEKRDFFRPAKEKNYFELKNKNHDEKETESERNNRSVLSNQQKDKEEDYDESDIKKEKKYTTNTKIELNPLVQRHLLFQLRWDDALNHKMINNIRMCCFLLRLINPKTIALSSIQRREMILDLIIQTRLTLNELIKRGILIIEPARLSVKNDGYFILYQTISLSLIHKSKYEANQKGREKKYGDKKTFDKSIPRHQRITQTRYKHNYDLLVPEMVLASRHRRVLRILIFFNFKNRNGTDRNSVFCNKNSIKHWGQFLDKNKHLDRDKHELIKLKFFLWPNYRLEELACMNRYWFDTNNGNHFSMLRIYMYPRFKVSQLM